MAEGKDDPFGSLIKLCQPTSSQELKFQTCSFAREFETFPDYLDSLATSSPETTPLDPVGIFIVSPPETDSQNSSSIDRSNTQDEDFLTPPENHNPSASSSQEGAQCLKPLTPGDQKGSDSIVAETTVRDDERAGNEVSVNIGEGEKNLGFSETQKIVSLDEVSEGQHGDSVNEVREIGRIFEHELKRFRSFNKELDKPRSKKIRVLKETMDSKINDQMIDDEIIDLDAEEIGQEIQFNEGKVIIDVDALSEEVAENGDGNVHKREKEESVYVDGGKKSLKVKIKYRNNDNNEVQRDGKTVSESGIKDKHGTFKCTGPGNGINTGAKERIPRDRHELTTSTKEKHVEGELSIGNIEEVQKSKNSGSSSIIIHEEKEKDAALSGGNKCLKIKWTSAPAESQEGIKHNSNNKAHGNRKAVLSSSSAEKIEKFRYDGPGKKVDQSAEKSVPRGRRELPPSIRENEEYVGGEESGDYMKVKNGSWKDLVDALEVVLGKVDDDHEDVDILETAKSRGLSFPQPRWIR